MALYLKNQIINSTYSNEDLLSKYEKKQVDQVVGNYPVRVVIPKLKIDVEVKPSRISEGFWEINKNSANFGIGSALPNQNGNTVIFAHSKKKEFGPLRAIKKDFEVSVQTLDGQWYKYKVVDKKEVKPYEVEYVLPTTEKTLTLFTCTGFADSKRLIVIAK